MILLSSTRSFSREPQRHFGHVLITSRLHHFTGQTERVDIEALEEDEGVKFLYRRTKRKRIAGSKEEQAAFALVGEMGGPAAGVGTGGGLPDARPRDALRGLSRPFPRSEGAF